MSQLRIVWMAMVGGVLAYTVLIWLLMSNGTLAMETLPRSLMTPVGAAVLLYMAAGVAVRRALVARIDRSRTREERIGAYTSATIVGLGLTESGGLVLVTMGLLSGSPGWVLAGGLSAAVLMLGARPDEAEIAG